MINIRKTSIPFIPIFFVLLTSFLIFVFSFSKLAFAGVGEEMLAQESWRKISLDLEGASLINVLKVFSQQSGLNFIAAQDVAGRSITLYMENVPIREALEKILNSYSLTYELDEDSNIFVVKQLIRPEVDTITRVYTLKYARLAGSPINTASATQHSGIVETIQQRLTSYGKLTEDTRTNSLVITDVPYAFEEIEMAIRELDVPVPQVLIEVEIIDTSKNLVDTLGFDWSGAGSLLTYTLWSHSLPNTTGSGGSHPGALSIGGPSGNTLSLSHLMTDSNTKVLARPKILTLSNEKAEIKITGNDVIGTTRTEDQEAQTVTVTAERGEIGVELIVTPSVNIQTGEITMVLEPKVTSAEDSGFTDGQGNTFVDPQERSAKVTVIAGNNQTIILGGLLRQDFSETRRKVPFLGDIPFLGALFRHKSKGQDSDREMLVFITPRIISEGGAAKFNQASPKYDTDLLSQREQSGYVYRKEEIDKVLSSWDN